MVFTFGLLLSFETAVWIVSTVAVTDKSSVVKDIFLLMQELFSETLVILEFKGIVFVTKMIQFEWYYRFLKKRSFPCCCSCFKIMFQGS